MPYHTSVFLQSPIRLRGRLPVGLGSSNKMTCHTVASAAPGGFGLFRYNSRAIQTNVPLRCLGYFGDGTYIKIGEPHDTMRAGLELRFVPPISACPALKATPDA